MYPEELQSIELDSASMDALIDLLNEQREEINPGIPALEAEIKELKATHLINPTREQEKKLQMAEVRLKTLRERLQRNELLETLVENARPASSDLVESGEQKHRFNAHVSKNDLALAEVAQHFASVLLERITTQSTAFSAEGIGALNVALGSSQDMGKFIQSLRDVINASDSIVQSCDPTCTEQSEYGSSAIATIKVFFIKLRQILLQAARANANGETLGELLRECEADQLSPQIDWPRAIPGYQHIPNLYPAAERAATKTRSRVSFSRFPGKETLLSSPD